MSEHFILFLKSYLLISTFSILALFLFISFLMFLKQVKVCGGFWEAYNLIDNTYPISAHNRPFVSTIDEIYAKQNTFKKRINQNLKLIKDLKKILKSLDLDENEQTSKDIKLKIVELENQTNQLKTDVYDNEASNVVQLKFLK